MESETRAQPDESKGVGSNPPAGGGAPSQCTPTDPARKSSDDSLIANALEQVDAGTGPKPGNGSQPAFGSGGVGPPLGALAANLPVGGSGPSSDNGSSVGGGAIPADIFPGYTLLKELHRGGQGVVYQAIQKATKRKVAIKVMRDGPFASPKDRIRFEREVEILAQLNHPNIVQVHDSGTVKSAGGTLQFFVMDYISGRTLMKHIAEHRPSNEEILKLFAKVCDAINSAHLKGVIHRDIKPGNVKVDSNGEPHVLDFGLAKASGSDVSGGDSPNVMTVTGEFIGSVAYASPEQAERDPNKIDVRTDVYALGVMLYEALTGGMPYSVLGNTIDVLERIKKSMPQRPSRVRKGINNEVETIVLKCLSKERDRRYQNAGELERDLQRYLAGEAIEAKRDAWWYLVRKKAIRHKAATMAIAFVFAAWVAAGAIAWGFYLRSEDARSKEAAALQASEQRRIEAETAKEIADREAMYSRRVADNFDSLISYSTPNYMKGEGGEFASRVLLRMSQAALAGMNDPPEVRARHMDTLGRAWLAVGNREKAKEFIDSALGYFENSPMRREHARSLMSLAEYYLDARDPVRALTTIEQARSIRMSIPAFSPLAIELMKSDLADCDERSGVAYRQLGKYEQADAAYRKALDARVAAFGPNHHLVAEVQSDIGMLAIHLGDFDTAVSSLSSAYDAAKSSFGEVDDRTGTTKSDLALALALRGRPEDLSRAVRLMQEVVSMLRALYAPVNPSHRLLGVTVNRLGVCLRAAGFDAEAEAAFREAVAIRAADPSTKPYLIAKSTLQLAMLYRDKGSPGLAEAERLFNETRQPLLAPDRPEADRAEWLREYAAFLSAQGNHEQAARAASDSLSVLEVASAKLPREEAKSRVVLAEAHLSLNRVADARTIVAPLIGQLRDDDLLLAEAKCILGLCAIAMNEHDKARELLRSSLEVSSSRPGHGKRIALRCVEAMLSIARTQNDHVGIEELSKTKLEIEARR